MTFTSRGALITTFALLAAVTSHVVADAPRPEPRERFERDDLQRLHMHENFDLLRAIERLLIVGKLDEARRFAAAISEAPHTPAHGPWATHVVTVRDRAAAVSRATTVDQAVRLVAALSGACAACHVESGVAPEFRTFPAPPDQDTIEARMLRHRWAADRLWEGIVGGVDEPWRAGLDVLAARPLDWGPAGSDRVVLARTLQRSALDAKKQRVPTLETRTKTYGEMLVSCAGCHTAKSRRK